MEGSEKWDTDIFEEKTRTHGKEITFKNKIF